MTIREIADAMELTLLSGDETTEIADGYCGDLLSWVMGRAPVGSMWVTIMSNQNVLAVAVLAEIRAVLFAEDVKPDDALLQKAQEEGIALLTSPKPAFELAGRLYTLLRRPA